MLVLTKLKWDVSAVVASDFLDHLLSRLKAMISDLTLKDDSQKRQQKVMATLRRRAATFVAVSTAGKSRHFPRFSRPSFPCLLCTIAWVSLTRFASQIDILSGQHEDVLRVNRLHFRAALKLNYRYLIKVIE